MFRYGTMLMSKGKAYVEAEAIVRDFNAKIPNPLTVDELRRTVFTSMARKAKEPINV
jgi:methyltransferase-like protein